MNYGTKIQNSRLEPETRAKFQRYLDSRNKTKGTKTPEFQVGPEFQVCSRLEPETRAKFQRYLDSRNKTKGTKIMMSLCDKGGP